MDRATRTSDLAPSSDNRAASGDPEGSLHHHRMKEPIEPRERSVEIGVAAVEQRLLFPRAYAAARRFTVLTVEGVSDVHPVDDAPEWCEALGILRIGQILQRDIDLRRPRVRFGERE